MAVISRDLLDEQAICEILAATLLAGRLVPGLRLGEHQLAGLFGVTRERIRKVLHRLGYNRLIDLRPNRGAFVADPGLAEAREIYQARRLLEVGVVFYLATTITPDQILILINNIENERRAFDAQDRAEAIRLSGLFHIHLAEMTNNQFVIRQMNELVGRTAMLVAYHENEAAQCGCDEHSSILRAISTQDPAKASREMQIHLSQIETRLQPSPAVRPQTMDLEKILNEEITRWLARSKNVNNKNLNVPA